MPFICPWMPGGPKKADCLAWAQATLNRASGEAVSLFYDEAVSVAAGYVAFAEGGKR